MSRYSRQIVYWSEEFQNLLFKQSVFVAGIGGLGCIVAESLTRAGVGTIIICDSGIIDESDLNRQSLYNENDLGKYKVDIAKLKLNAINSSCNIIKINTAIDKNFVFDFKNVVVFDCLDNYTSRNILYNKIPKDIYFIHAGLDAYIGQVITLLKGKSKNLSEIFAGLNDKKNIPVTPDAVHIISGIMVREYFNILKKEPKLLEKFLIINFEELSLDYL
ncbi:ThiF family adenylyltransferase, partial [Deferribacterales bacterium Es71-Z0220]|uniref:HesA/MoeB/ThiF family protein n=1 Tax=Deferrivibrio essentukiensis TaxID=2880922 RepID=UPI0031011B5F|nr:ThiF family adenylyltransferase [Deferrivibrio essentukiensis]